MSNTITGRIAVLKPTQVVSDKFSKQEVWLKTEGEYPQTICLEFHNASMALLNGYSQGDNVTIDYNLRGKEWNDRCFNTLQAWKITRVGGESQPQPTQAQQAINEARANNAPAVAGNDPNLGLPF